jgi:hypothetical protein
MTAKAVADLLLDGDTSRVGSYVAASQAWGIPARRSR